MGMLDVPCGLVGLGLSPAPLSLRCWQVSSPAVGLIVSQVLS